MSDSLRGERTRDSLLMGLTTLVMGVGSASQVSAQTLPSGSTGLPSQSDISRQRVPMPLPETPKFNLRIQSPERSAVPKAVDAFEFTLSRVEVEGATVFPTETLDAVFAPLTRKVIRLDEVRAAAAKLEEMYHAKGYFLSRVFVPPQRIEDNKLIIRVVEGYIDSVHVTGLDAGSRAVAYRQLSKVMARKPINLATIERLLLILNDTPGITATSVLQQGSDLGASEIHITLAQPKTVIQANVSNSNSKILGPWTYGVNLSLSRPFALPGALSVGGSASGPGFGLTQSANMRYSLGIGRRGLLASVGALAAFARPGANLLPLNVRNRLVSVSARLRYPLVRSRAKSLYLEGGLALTRSTTDILGQRISEDRQSVADIGLTFQQVGVLKGTTTANVTVYRGMNILGANGRSAPLPSVIGFNPTFTRLNSSLQRLQTIAPRISALVSMQGQYTESKLLTGEAIAFGGPAIGRGYDPSTIAGDRGIGGLAELRYDLPVGKPWLAGTQFYTFADTGRTTSLAGPTTPEISANLNSFGGGVRFFLPRVVADLQITKARVQFKGANQTANPRVLLSVTSSF